MLRPHLVLEHSQQVRNHIQPLRQQPHPLVHLQIAPHRAVHRLELRLRPHQLGAVEHGTLQVDVDAQDEELPDLHRDLASCQRDGAGEGELRGEGVREGDGGAEEVFEEGGLDALGQGVRDGEFGHVVLLLAQADEVVVDARLVLARVVEVEVLDLHVVGGEFLGREFGDVFEEALFLRGGHAPDYDGAVFEEEDFRGVDLGVEVEGVRARGVWGVEGTWVEVGDVIREAGFAVSERGVAGFGVQVYKIFAGLLAVGFDFNSAVGEAALWVGPQRFDVFGGIDHG